MNRKTLAIILGVNLVLVGTIVTLYFTVWKPSQTGEEGLLTITGLIDEDIQLTIEQLEALPNISREYLLQGTPTYSANYTGVSVYYLVNTIANITNSTLRVKVKAIDNYVYTLDMDEINVTRDIIIAYKINGEYLKSGSNGGNGPLRLIIPQRFSGEYNGQYCVKFVVTLQIVTGV